MVPFVEGPLSYKFFPFLMGKTLKCKKQIRQKKLTQENNSKHAVSPACYLWISYPTLSQTGSFTKMSMCTLFTSPFFLVSLFQTLPSASLCSEVTLSFITFPGQIIILMAVPGCTVASLHHIRSHTPCCGECGRFFLPGASYHSFFHGLKVCVGVWALNILFRM